MKTLFPVAVILAVFRLGDAYSKYGRTCKDIGCPSNQICVMEEDPCNLYSRNNECGKYPTCKKVSDAAATCATYVCPPTKICKMDGGVPKCFDDPAATGTRQNKQPVQSYNPGAPIGESPSAPNLPPNQPQANYPQNPGYNPNYPQNSGYNPNYPPQSNYPQNPGVYPNLPSGGIPGQTTQRPNVYQPGQRVYGGGYQGGAVGSGYPGQGNGYPAQGGGYPAQGAYPGQQYPGQGGYTNQGGYPKQGGGGYPTQGGGSYPPQGGYQNQNRGGQRFNQKSGQDSSNPLLDRITDTLKTIGLFWFLVKYMVSRVYCIYS